MCRHQRWTGCADADCRWWPAGGPTPGREERWWPAGTTREGWIKCFKNPTIQERQRRNPTYSILTTQTTTPGAATNHRSDDANPEPAPADKDNIGSEPLATDVGAQHSSGTWRCTGTGTPTLAWGTTTVDTLSTTVATQPGAERDDMDEGTDTTDTEHADTQQRTDANARLSKDNSRDGTPIEKVTYQGTEGYPVAERGADDMNYKAGHYDAGDGSEAGDSEFEEVEDLELAEKYSDPLHHVVVRRVIDGVDFLGIVSDIEVGTLSRRRDCTWLSTPTATSST